MFKFFSALFKTIAVSSKTVETGLEITASTLNEVNKSLDTFSNNLKNSIELKKQLFKIAKEVYSNDISFEDAKQKVIKNFGMQSYEKFEHELDRFRTIDIESSVFKILPVTKDSIIVSKKEDVLNLLIKKYGSIDLNEFNFYLDDRRRQVIDFISGGNKISGKSKNKYHYESLNEQELYEEYVSTSEVYEKMMNELRNKYKI